MMEMIPPCGILVNACPSCKETNGMYNARVFGAMKKTACFRGMSRGALVDDHALAAAPKEGRIAGAGLDVTKQEPLPSSSVLRDAPNPMLGCHSWEFSPGRQLRLIGPIAGNVRRYSTGLPSLNSAGKVRGY